MHTAILSLTLFLALGTNAFADSKGKPPSPPAKPNVPVGKSDVPRADALLANRLAVDQHLRDVAAKNGNPNLLKTADKGDHLALKLFLIHNHCPQSP